jgi:diguanylate cyclase (GGDEF)-like protein
MKPLTTFRTWYRHEKDNLHFFKGNWRYIFVWPVVGTVLAGSLWGAALNRLAAEEGHIRVAAADEALSLALVYSKQIERSIEQLDELTLYIKHDWEASKGSFRLENLHKKGLLSTGHFTSFLIVGTDGRLVSSTIKGANASKLSFADREYFAYHASNASLDLRIGMPTVGRLTGKRVIHLTRRLNKADGSFGGVLVVGMPFEFFSPLSTAPLFGKTGMLALVGEDGGVRVTGVGGEVNQVAKVSMAKTPDFNSLEWQNLGLANRGSARVLNETWFSDHERRIAATSALSAYPFHTLVALTEKDVLATYQAARAEVLRVGMASTFVLSFFVLAAMFLSARLVVRKAEEAESRQAYRLATEGGNEGFYLWNALRDRTGEIIDFRVIDCNERGAELYGSRKDALLSKTLRGLYGDVAAESLIQLHRTAFARGFHEGDFESPAGSGVAAQWIHQKMVRTREGLAVTWRDVTEQRTNAAKMERLATEDALTGLPNRYWMTTNLPRLLTQAKDQSSKLALFFIDLDNFKNVNDTLGHSAGDELLKSAAARLRSLVRPSDYVVRLGGDEFTVILDPVASSGQVAQVAARIVAAFKEPFELEQGSNFVGTSIGIGIFPDNGTDAETLTKNADIAMYAAKVAKGEYRFYEQHMYERFRNLLDIEHELQRGLEQDQFIVMYQPRCDTFTGQVVGLEALVRWNHPERGFVPPGEFIPAAESTGLVLKLGAVVVEKVCEQISVWRAAGASTVPVSVNVSARQFNQGEVTELIRATLAKYNLAPNAIEIELTESMMMDEGSVVRKQLAELDIMGIRLHVDDFGTGYSSLSLLQRLKLDVLKVDQAFTSKLGTSAEGEIFFHAIVSMAHALGMAVVAEGVETEKQLHLLQGLNCDEVQGFYLARPTAAADIPALLAKRTLFPVPEGLPVPRIHQLHITKNA